MLAEIPKWALEGFNESTAEGLLRVGLILGLLFVLVNARTWLATR